MQRKKRGRSVRAGSGDVVRGFTSWMYISWLSISSHVLDKTPVADNWENVTYRYGNLNQWWMSHKGKMSFQIMFIPFLRFSLDEKCFGLSTQQLNVGC